MTDGVGSGENSESPERGGSLTPSGRDLPAPQSTSLARKLASGLLATDEIQEVHCFAGHTSWITRISIFGDDQLALTSGEEDRTLRLWDLRAGSEIRVFRGHEEPIVSSDVSSDGAVAASTSADGTLRFWDLVDGGCLRTIQTDEIGAVQFTMGNRYLLTGHEDFLRLWNLGGEIVRVYQLPAEAQMPSWSPISSIRLSPDGRFALLGSNQSMTVVLFDLQSGRCDEVFEGHEDFVWSVGFSREGNHVLSAGWDGTVRMWDRSSGKQVSCLVHPGKRGGGHSETGLVNDFRVTPYGNTLISVCEDVVRVWDLNTGSQVTEFQGPEAHYFTSIAVSSTGEFALAGIEVGRVYLLSLPDWVRRPPGQGADRAGPGIFQPQAPEALSPGQRIIRFPEQRSLGDLLLADEQADLDTWDAWDHFRDAKGVIRVPLGKILKLDITPEGAENVSPLRNLGPLDLAALEMASATASALRFVSHLTGLRWINIPADVDDQSIRLLEGLERLEILWCLGADNLAGVGLRFLDRLDDLRRLDLAYCSRLDDTFLEFVQGRRSLQWLRLEETSVRGTGFHFLQDCQVLNTLDLSLTRVIDHTIEQLPLLPILADVNLGGTEVGDRAAQHLANLPSIKSLNFWKTNISNKGLSPISRVEGLERLMLGDTRVTDEGARELECMRDLKHLNLAGTRVTSGLIRQLRTGLPGTEIVGP